MNWVFGNLGEQATGSPFSIQEKGALRYELAKQERSHCNRFDLLSLSTPHDLIKDPHEVPPRSFHSQLQYEVDTWLKDWND